MSFILSNEEIKNSTQIDEELKKLLCILQNRGCYSYSCCSGHYEKEGWISFQESVELDRIKDLALELHGVGRLTSNMSIFGTTKVVNHWVLRFKTEDIKKIEARINEENVREGDKDNLRDLLMKYNIVSKKLSSYSVSIDFVDTTSLRYISSKLNNKYGLCTIKLMINGDIRLIYGVLPHHYANLEEELDRHLIKEE